MLFVGERHVRDFAQVRAAVMRMSFSWPFASCRVGCSVKPFASRHAWLFLGLFVPLLLAAGCPTGGSKAPVPGAACVERYAKCRMPDGPLGVCNDAPCAEGETPPCFRCISQH